MYIGHIVSADVLWPDQEKIQAFVNIPLKRAKVCKGLWVH